MTLSKNYEGSKVLCEYDSSNIKAASYDINTKTLTITFGNQSQYEYTEVPHEVFAEFNLAESQGKYFNTSIGKKFSYKKIV